MDRLMKKFMGFLAGIMMFAALLEGVTEYRIRKIISRD
jgi:zinc transporter ZupT